MAQSWALYLPRRDPDDPDDPKKPRGNRCAPRLSVQTGLFTLFHYRASVAAVVLGYGVMDIEITAPPTCPLSDVQCYFNKELTSV